MASAFTRLRARGGLWHVSAEGWGFHSGKGWDAEQTTFTQGPSSISIQGGGELIDPKGAVLDQALRLDHDFREREAYRVHVTLMRDVVSISLDPPRSIALELEGGYTLRFIDDSEHHESFVIEIDRMRPGHVLYVV